MAWALFIAFLGEKGGEGKSDNIYREQRVESADYDTYVKRYSWNTFVCIYRTKKLYFSQ